MSKILNSILSLFKTKETEDKYDAIINETIRIRQNASRALYKASLNGDDKWFLHCILDNKKSNSSEENL